MRALLTLLALVCLLGCTTPDAVLELGRRDIDYWRKVRDEGRTWTDDQWHKRLSVFTANARMVDQWIREREFKPLDALKFKDEELAR